MLVSSITTAAPIPLATLAADMAATPAPIITTLAGATPGTPPNNFPFRLPDKPSANKFAPHRAAC